MRCQRVITHKLTYFDKLTSRITCINKSISRLAILQRRCTTLSTFYNYHSYCVMTTANSKRKKKKKKKQQLHRRELTGMSKIEQASLPANKSASFRVGCDSSGGSIDRKRFRGSRVGRPRVSLHYQSIFRSSTRSRPTYYILFSQLVVQCCTSAFASWPTVKQRKSRSLPIDRRSLLCSN